MASAIFISSLPKIPFDPACSFLGSVSSRECLDAPTILATFTAGRTGLVECPWRHYSFNNFADNPHAICLNFICFFLLSWKKAKCEKYAWNVPLKVWNFKKKTKSRYIMSRILPRKFQGACLWLVSLNNNQTRAPSREGGENRGRIETLTTGDWA